MNTLGCSRVHDSFHFYIFLGMTFRIIFVWLTIHFKERNTVKPRETLRFTIITEAAKFDLKKSTNPSAPDRDRDIFQSKQPKKGDKTTSY